MSELVLKVGGRDYSGWTRINVELGIDVMAGVFDIGVIEKDEQAELPVIEVGAACEVEIDGETLITGYIDEAPRYYNPRERGLTIRGRDATGDLVDCSARHPSGQWTGAKLGRIARDLCKPFGIPVVVATDEGEPFLPSFRINAGEAVMETLQRAARQRGVLLRSDGLGSLVIARAGQSRAPDALQLGVNIVEGSGGRQFLNRYSEYRVLAQQPQDEQAGVGLDSVDVQGRATDGAVRRYRPLDLLAEDNGSLGSAQQRADWEQRTRAGASLSAVYTVLGWRHSAGLWRPDQRVYVRDPWLRIEQTLLIAGVRYRLDDRGERAELMLTLPEAYDRIAMPDPDQEPGQ